MTKFNAISTGKGLSVGSPYNKARFYKDLEENKGARYQIMRLTPESDKQRSFYHGAIISLWAYLNGMDFKDSATLKWLHEHAKKEFNGEIVMLDGKETKRGKTTKGKLNQGYIDRVVDFLEEQYGIDRGVVFDPELYKKWKNEIYAFGGADSFIEYMQELNLI